MCTEIHDGSELKGSNQRPNTDARPHIRPLDEVLLQRTAGPYIGSNATNAGWLSSWGSPNEHQSLDLEADGRGPGGYSGAFRVRVSEVAAWPTSIVSTVSKLSSRSQQLGRD